MQALGVLDGEENFGHLRDRNFNWRRSSIIRPHIMGIEGGTGGQEKKGVKSTLDPCCKLL